jgi:hypothetical protein
VKAALRSTRAARATIAIGCQKPQQSRLSAAIRKQTGQRMQHRPDTDTNIVDTADGIKRASAHAARVYRQKYRQIALAETRKGTVKWN